MTLQQLRGPCRRGHIIRRAGRVDRRPLRHLQGVRCPRVHHRTVPCALAPFQPTVRVVAFPVRALSAFGGVYRPRLLERLIVHCSLCARSDRRGSPRPCSLFLPGAYSSRLPLRTFHLLSTTVTARVRRPTLSTLPFSYHSCSHSTLPTAPSERRRPSNLRLQLTGTRLARGASRRQARACT